MNDSTKCADFHLFKLYHDADNSGGMMGTLRILIIDQIDELTKHAEAWNARAYKASPRLPTSSYAWISS